MARTRLESPIEIGGMRVPNRLYRAPLLECAGTDESTVDTLIQELEPAAASGTGLIFQGASVVTGSGGCVAPNMTRVSDPTFVRSLDRLTDAIHDHGGRIALQIDHGGLRTLETWHRGYRASKPDLEQFAVSEPPLALRFAEKLDFLSYDLHPLSTDEIEELAVAFGRAAGAAVEAGYDGIHLGSANMGLLQQFLSPYYNRREDEFGGSLAGRVRILERIHDEIRDRVGDVPLMAKVPAETAAPPFVRRHLSRSDGVRIAKQLESIGYDALAPVEVSTFWDLSLTRGAYPDRAWNADQFQAGYTDAFGSSTRAAIVDLATRVESWFHSFEPGWNEAFCRAVRERVDVPVLCEGGIRERAQMDRLLETGACDLVGMGRPFYAEPRLAARILNGSEEWENTRVLCESCNNCIVPQATGAPGICRTPSVLRRRGKRQRAGEYGRQPSDRGTNESETESS